MAKKVTVGFSGSPRVRAGALETPCVVRC
jgi:hypothetical protein